uniref:ArsA/GET3 Anion-transporting ATPase-like domain-containing protein n=1 Tax=Brassica oleracea var. oleracea TaxID=109376 RepID=A0A0D3C6V3_BRAOL
MGIRGRERRCGEDDMQFDPTVETEDLAGPEGMDSLFSDLANAIPGIDEAMSFAQFPATLEKGLSKLKSRFGGLMNQMSRLFGMEDELGEDALLGRLEGLKDVIQHVNRQFKDPDLTTFVCVCIPEFLSLYETERLISLGTRKV